MSEEVPVGRLVSIIVSVLSVALLIALTGLIVTYMTFVLPFSVWTLRGFLIGIPKDLEEAAMVDGSTRLGVFLKILLPLMGPGLVATSVFAFITTWNEYIFARVLLNDQSKQTVTVWLSYFVGSSRHTDSSSMAPSHICWKMLRSRCSGGACGSSSSGSAMRRP